MLSDNLFPQHKRYSQHIDPIYTYSIIESAKATVLFLTQGSNFSINYGGGDVNNNYI